MLMAPQVTFRGLSHDPQLEQEILERITWLGKFYEGIVSCRVLVEVPHRHRHDGRHFHVTIELTVPDGEAIVIAHEPSRHGRLKHIDVEEHLKRSETASVRRYQRVAIHEAFDAARRRLQDFARRQRKAVKTHETPAHGVVADISAADGFGFINSADGNRIYFNRRSVLDDAFDDLTVGSAVTFVEEHGNKGPQASTVRPLGKHHYVP